MSDITVMPMENGKVGKSRHAGIPNIIFGAYPHRDTATQCTYNKLEAHGHSQSTLLN
jgi:hypothetical protein